MAYCVEFQEALANMCSPSKLYTQGQAGGSTFPVVGMCSPGFQLGMGSQFATNSYRSSLERYMGDAYTTA